MPLRQFRVWWVLVPILTTAAQGCMKLLANYMGGTELGVTWAQQAVTTPWLPIMVLCEMASFVLWMRILETVDISRALPISAVAYLSILLMSWFLFDEPLFPLQLVGSVLILAGIRLISTSSTPPTPTAAP